MAEVMEAAPNPMALQQGATQARRKRANTVITTGMHGSHRTAQPRPPPVVVNSEPTETRARGRTHAIVRMEQASAERDAAYQRELLEAETAGQPRPPQKLSELQSAFGDIDKVCVGLLREGKVPETLQYLETLRGMVDTIVTQLEPKVAPTDRLVLPTIAGLTPRGATGKHSRRPLSERGSNATRMRSGDPQPQPPHPPKDGPRKGDDRLMDLKNAEAKKLREQLAEKDEKIAEQAKRLDEVDEKIATMKEKHKRVELNSKLLVKSAESKVESLTAQVSQLTAENRTLQTRYQETAAVVGLDYKEKSNALSRVNENQEWEGKVRGSRRVVASAQNTWLNAAVCVLTCVRAATSQILELAAAEQTIDHLQDKLAGEKKKAKFLKQKVALYEAKEADYRGAGEHMQALHDKCKAAAENQARTAKKLSLREEQLKKTSAELESLKQVVEGGRANGEEMVAENKALKAKLESTLSALAAKQSRLRKLEKALKKQANAQSGGVIGDTDFKALHAELAGFLTLLEDPPKATA